MPLVALLQGCNHFLAKAVDQVRGLFPDGQHLVPHCGSCPLDLEAVVAPLRMALQRTVQQLRGSQNTEA